MIRMRDKLEEVFAADRTAVSLGGPITGFLPARVVQKTGCRYSDGSPQPSAVRGCGIPGAMHQMRRPPTADGRGLLAEHLIPDR
jgi:hypothetical protein